MSTGALGNPVRRRRGRQPARPLAASRRWDLLLLAPLLAVFTVGFVVPLGRVLRFSFDSFSAEDGQVPAWSLSQYTRVATSGYFHDLLARTFGMALGTVLIAAALGYPLALAISRGPRRLRPYLLVAAVLPLLVSVVVKTFGWTVLLGTDGPVASLLGAFGVSHTLLFTPAGVVVGLVHTFLPFMVLSLVGSLDSLDRRIEEAAASLGSGPWQVFWRVTFPQTLKGLTTGSILVFVLAVSAFVIPQLLGGGRVTTLVGVIYDQATQAQNWPLACAAGVLLLLVTLAALSVNRVVINRASHD